MHAVKTQLKSCTVKPIYYSEPYTLYSHYDKAHNLQQLWGQYF